MAERPGPVPRSASTIAGIWVSAIGNSALVGLKGAWGLPEFCCSLATRWGARLGAGQPAGG